MNKVAISFNNKTWNKEGTHYRGRFAVKEEIVNEFIKYVETYLEKYKDKIEMDEKMFLPGLKIEHFPQTEDKLVFLKITQRKKFIAFLNEKGIKFDQKRASKEMNYYIKVI